jgi:YVTN family beta-propeller protein
MNKRLKGILIILIIGLSIIPVLMLFFPVSSFFGLEHLFNQSIRADSKLIDLFIIYFKNMIHDSDNNNILEVKNWSIRTPEDIDIDPLKNKVFVGNRGSESITVIDGNTNEVERELSLWNGTIFIPQHIAVDPNNDLLYAAGDFLSDIKLSIIDLNKGTITQNITNIPRLKDLEVNTATGTVFATDGMNLMVSKKSNGKIVLDNLLNLGNINQISVNNKLNKIYALDSESNTVSIVDGETGKLEPKKIDVVTNSDSIDVNPQSDKIYVSNIYGNRISIIDGRSLNVTTTIISANQPSDNTEGNLKTSIAVNPNTNLVYLGNSRSDLISIMDGNVNKVIKSIVVDGPEILKVNPNSNLIYGINGVSDEITLIDGNINEVVIGRNPYFKLAGIPIGDLGSDSQQIDLDPMDNKIYFLGSKKIFIMDGQLDKVIDAIQLKYVPVSIVVNPIADKIYTSNCLDDTYSILDINSGEVKNFNVTGITCRIQYDEGENLVLMNSRDPKNGGSFFIGLNSSSDTVLFNYSIPIEFSEFDYDSEHKMLYAVEDVFVDDGIKSYLVGMDLENEILKPRIELGDSPEGVFINENTALIYVVNHNSHSISVIDEYTNRLIADISVGTFPSGISINKKNNLIYVTNTHSDSISIIDGNINRVIHTLPAGNYPTSIAADPINDMAYVINAFSNTISIIDSKNNKVVVGINTNVEPPNYGFLICNDKKITNSSDYQRYILGSQLKCEAYPNKGYVFSEWAGDLVTTSNENSRIELPVTKFGNVTAKFTESNPSVDFIIPTETLIQIIIIVITAIVGWSIPTIVGLINKKLQKKSLVNYSTAINTSHNNPEELERLKKDLSKEYAEGKMSLDNYNLLDDLVDYYLQRINDD